MKGNKVLALKGRVNIFKNKSLQLERAAEAALNLVTLSNP